MERESILEILYGQYTRKTLEQDPVLREKSDAFEKLLEPMTYEIRNAIGWAANEIGVRAEHNAFLDGVVVGAKLMLEILRG